MNASHLTKPASIPDLIRNLGGRSAVAGIVQKSVSAVSKWRQDGIPSRHFQTLVEYGRNADPAIDWMTFDFLVKLNDTVPRRTEPLRSIAA